MLNAAKGKISVKNKHYVSLFKKGNTTEFDSMSARKTSSQGCSLVSINTSKNNFILFLFILEMENYVESL